MKIAVYTICKNEEKYISGWYETAKPADYRILVDTGSTDGSQNYAPHEIVVAPFRFDVARNAALSLVPADADVCVSLDLDERLRPGWRKEIEDAYAKVPEVDRKCAIRFSATYNRKGMQPFWHNSRVHSRSGFVWKEPCHEALFPWMASEMTIQMPNFHIDHFPDETKPRTSYLPLLAWGLNEEPWNSRRIFYYARELLMYHHYEQALGWFKQYKSAWEQDPDREDNEEVRMVFSFIQLCEGAIKERDATAR